MYQEVKEMYAAIGVDVEQALEQLAKTPISRIVGRAMTSWALSRAQVL